MADPFLLAETLWQNRKVLIANAEEEVGMENEEGRRGSHLQASHGGKTNRDAFKKDAASKDAASKDVSNKGSSNKGISHKDASQLKLNFVEIAEHPLETAAGFYASSDCGNGASSPEDASAAPLFFSPTPPYKIPATPGPASPSGPPSASNSTSPSTLKTSVSGAHRSVSKGGFFLSKKADTPGSSKPKISKEKRSDSIKAKKGALFMTVIFAINLLVIVLSGQGEEFVHALDNAIPSWVLAGVFMMVLYTFFATLAYIIAASLDPNGPVGIRDCISIEANGALFGNLTPSNSGAVPAQIYRLTQTGLDIGESSAIQFTRFIMFQLGEIIIAAIMLWLKLDYFLQTDGDFIIINIVVFIIMGLQVFALLMICLFPRFVLRIVTFVIHFVRRRGWMNAEKLENGLSYISDQISVFSRAFKSSIKHFPSLLLTLVVTFCQLLCLYSVPWFVLCALGQEQDFLTCVAAAAMVQMIANSVPLPGGTGGVEAGFIFFFGPLFGETAAAGFMLWRIITFYLPTIISLPLTTLKSRSHKSLHNRIQEFLHLSRRSSVSRSSRKTRCKSVAKKR